MKKFYFLLSLFLPLFVSGQETEPIQEIKTSIYFDNDQAVITSKAKITFQTKILNIINNEEVLEILIQGHTDGFADDMYNQNLSERRVDSVKSLFPDNLFSKAPFTLKGYGKSKPVSTNDTDEGRSKNRRVDILIKFRHILTIGEIDMTVEDKFENDTIIYGEKGTELHIRAKTFYPNKISDVDFNIKEVYSLKDMVQNNTVTMTSDGQCLESGGMVFSSATIDGQKANLQQDMLVRIPASEIDTAMKIYSVDVIDGDTLWKETSMALNFNEENGFYEFNSRSMPNFNVDKVPVAGLLLAPIVGFLAKIKEKNLTVKSRRYKYAKSYLVGSEKKMVLNGRVFKPKKSQFQPCNTDMNDMVISYATKKDETYFFAKPLGALKYRRFFNRYIIKKKNYQKMSADQIEEKLDTILASL